MKRRYEVDLRRAQTGETIKKRVFAESQKEAEISAVRRARVTHTSSMAEREYGQFDVISCSVMECVPPTE